VFSEFHFVKRKRLAEQAVKTFSRFVEENIEKFGRVLERKETNRPRIDDIEEVWGELKTRTNQIITATGQGELYDGLAKTVPEKEMIAKKRELGEQGVAVSHGGAREKRIQTIHGELRLKRSVLKVKHEGGEEGKRMKEAVPLDEYWG
jgi:hypothetical protein